MTARELASAGIHRQVLSRLVAAGEIERMARGLYRLPEHAQSKKRRSPASKSLGYWVLHGPDIAAGMSGAGFGHNRS